jgi:excisionase family DNA binding protein
MNTQNAAIARLASSDEVLMPMPSRFLSRSAVARLFGVSASTVTRWARTGLLKTIRTPGGHYRFPEEETRRAAAAGMVQEPS